jgi:hypothetical protein
MRQVLLLVIPVILCAASLPEFALVSSQSQSRVFLGVVSFSPTTIGAKNDSATLAVTVATTTAVPNGATATVEVLETGNEGQVAYTVAPARQQTVTLAGGGVSTQVTFTFKTSAANDNGGTIVTRASLASATQAEVGTPATVDNLRLTVNPPRAPGDEDGDGYRTLNSPYDCDDSDPTAYPGAPISDYCYWGSQTPPYLLTDKNCNGEYDQYEFECDQSPILIDVAGNGFTLTDRAGGVEFDIDGNGTNESLAWTAAGSDDAWLALDRNGNGRIDSGQELFGNFTPQPASAAANGFAALAEFDRPVNGGNGDGRIDAGDTIFISLKLWRDVNHNGVSEPEELSSLSSSGVVAIDLDYRESRRQDQHGNIFRYRAKAFASDPTQVGTWACDVFLVRGRTSR